MSYTFRGMTVLSGSGNYSKPADVTALLVRALAGGGGGGGASSGLAVEACSGGGAGGSYLEKLLTSPGSSIAYAVGGGGAGGTDSVTNGSPGTDTTFDTLTASGGLGGIATSGIGAQGVRAVSGGAAGVTGDVNAQGRCSQVTNNTYASGSKQTGTGGGSPIGAGGKSIVSNGSSSQNGNAGTFCGAGGSGAKSRNSNAVGGAGSAGSIVLFELEQSGPAPAPPATGGLSPGIVTTLVANQVYAAPSGSSFIYYQGTQPQQSADQITWTNITNGTMVAGGFIRSTAGDTIISLKRKVK